MRTLKIISLLLLGVLLIIIVVQNTAPVQARLLWLEAELPVIVLLLVVAIGAFTAGLLVSMIRSRKKTNTGRRSSPAPREERREEPPVQEERAHASR